MPYERNHAFFFAAAPSTVDIQTAAADIVTGHYSMFGEDVVAFGYYVSTVIAVNFGTPNFDMVLQTVDKGGTVTTAETLRTSEAHAAGNTVITDLRLQRKTTAGSEGPREVHVDSGARWRLRMNAVAPAGNSMTGVIVALIAVQEAPALQKGFAYVEYKNPV